MLLGSICPQGPPCVVLLAWAGPPSPACSPLFVWDSAHCSVELEKPRESKREMVLPNEGTGLGSSSPLFQTFPLWLHELFLHSQSISKWSDLKSQLLQREAEFMKNQGSSSYHGNCFKTEKPNFAILAALGGFSMWKDDRVYLPHSPRYALCVLCSGAHRLLKTMVFA